MNIPNLLTTLRVVLIPFMVLVYLLPIDGRFLLAAAIYTLAAITDWLDGYLARRWNQQTPFGAFFDPLADKLIVATALALLIHEYADWALTLPAMVIIGREITISALREWMAEIGKRAHVAVSTIGKWKTGCQMVAIIGLLGNPPGFWLADLSLVLLYIAAALTLWSMYIYLRAAWPELVKGISQ